MIFDKHPGPWKAASASRGVKYEAIDGFDERNPRVEKVHFDAIIDANGEPVISASFEDGLDFSSMDVARAIIALGGK